MTPNSEQNRSMFSGSIVALVTPFTDSGGVDYAALGGLLEFHLEQGSDGLVIAGTTGESATLNRKEFRELLAWVVREVDGALVVTPYYNRPTQPGLEAHFTAVASTSAIPIVLYNVPSRTAVDMLPATVERLSAHPRIVGIKEAVGDPRRIEELRARCGRDFLVFSGDDSSCLRAMRGGADGVVSVAANVAPALMHEMCVLAGERDWEAAERIGERLQPLFGMLSVETNPIPVKWALFELGRAGAGIRLPLTPLAESHRAPLRQCLETLELPGV
jgi:4-hydroxy-tetrahydrodipicolinate synthase